MPDAMQHLAKEIMVTAAVTICGYVVFVCIVVLLAHGIDWIRCGGLRNGKAKGSR